MFKRNYLKELYNVDEDISELKARKKELLTIIKQDGITEQGKYVYTETFYSIRRVVIEKFRQLVTKEQFEQSIVVPLEKAEKFITSDDMKKIVREESKQSYKITRR